ncbi:hypothetical protein GOP47_0016277 [Adiantum capillus-veneris]|uniref:Uncharacterized protein n=1 Tax=Adiantum capillus-veneris TaxID=13818 RepID=A0A9D4UHT5_ADICA|nr:hypothetical protein GOP47_0016277 [Adiantum capillus-veneris]
MVRGCCMSKSGWMVEESVVKEMTFGLLVVAAYLPRSLVSAAGYGFPLRRGGLPSSFSLRVSNGDDSRSSEERARTTLKELDDQLSSGDAPPRPRPRPLPGIGTEIEKPAPVKGSVPVLSDGLLVYIAGGPKLILRCNIRS